MSGPWARRVWVSYLPKLSPGPRPDDYDDHRAAISASLTRPGRTAAFTATTRTSHAPAEARLDDVHTPAWLLEAAQNALARVGHCRINEPFQGTYVPLRHHGSDPRVASIMIEIRRDVYCDKGGELAPTWPELAKALAQLARDAAR